MPPYAARLFSKNARAFDGRKLKNFSHGKAHTIQSTPHLPISAQWFFFIIQGPLRDRITHRVQQLD